MCGQNGRLHGVATRAEFKYITESFSAFAERCFRETRALGIQMQDDTLREYGIHQVFILTGWDKGLPVGGRDHRRTGAVEPEMVYSKGFCGDGNQLVSGCSLLREAQRFALLLAGQPLETGRGILIE